ncbi:MAG: hypothetical protein ABL927_15310, partial [Bdellovibrionales bacterium]
VMREWEWSDFFSVNDYIEQAKNAGFAVEKKIDWSQNVTGPLELTFKTLAWLGAFSFTRKILIVINPLLKSLTNSDWKEILASALAHDYVRKNVNYTALVLTKV